MSHVKKGIVTRKMRTTVSKMCNLGKVPFLMWQRAPKLHHLLRQLSDAVAIDAEPGVVDDHPGPAVELVLDSHRGELEVGVGQGT